MYLTPKSISYEAKVSLYIYTLSLCILMFVKGTRLLRPFSEV